MRADVAVCRAASPGSLRGGSKPVNSRRILDQDLVANRRLGCPDGELVQHAAVVDRQRWPEIGGAPAWPPCCIRMGPVAPPYDALGVGRDQRLRQGQNVRIFGWLLRNAIGRRDLYIR